jgi:hypothetical protein
MGDRLYLSRQVPKNFQPTPAPNPLEPRPFAPQTPVSPQQQDMPDLQAKGEKRRPLTHNFANIDIFPPSGTVPPPNPPTFQRKLAIGKPNDVYEQEADRVARQVVNQINSPQTVQREEMPEDEEELQMKSVSGTLQREEMPEDEEELQMKSVSGTIQREEMPEDEEELQMKSASDTLQREEMPEEEEELQMKSMVQPQTDGEMAATPDLEASIQRAKGGGQPLSDNIREPMEQAFGADFSGVRVHTDGTSDQLNQSIQAKAFTTGQDVFFRQGAYQPGSKGGQELIAHELTHVVQQKPNSVKSTSQVEGLIQRRVMTGQVRGVMIGKRRLYNRAGRRVGTVPRNTPLRYDSAQTLNNGNKHLYRITNINAATITIHYAAATITNQQANLNLRDLWISRGGVQNVVIAPPALARGQLQGPGPHIVYDGNHNQVANFLEGAQFDYDTNQVVTGPGNGVDMHPVINYNKDDLDQAVNNTQLYIAPAQVQNAGGQTYQQEKQQFDQDALQTTTRLKAGRHGARRGIGHSNQLNQQQAAAACYNFAVGSFNNNNDLMHLQAAAPEYVTHRYGAITGQVPTRINAINAVVTGSASITPARARAIDNLMIAAGANLTTGHTNPDYFGAGGTQFKQNLKIPLQKYVLRESGLRPNPEGNWAVGFRVTNDTLGSDHAWLMALVPGHPNRYISFDTFPNYDRVQASRKKHSDPYTPRQDESDYSIRITGPTQAQWLIVQQVGNVGGQDHGSDDRTNLDPH